ncbi:MAG: FeoB-associated Cys-rich membrane protein [Lachnospiraceae bacterium]
MLEFLIANLGSIVVGAIILVLVGLVIRSMIRDKKNGVSLHCGGNCKNCHGGCGK